MISEFNREYIGEYISNIDWESGKWDVKQIKSDLKKIIGYEIPAVDIQYSNITKINEIKKESVTESKVTAIEIWYTIDDVPQRLKFLV